MNLIQCSRCHQEQEIQKLQLFLMRYFQGRLDGEKTPVENAIELLRRGMNEDQVA